MLTLTAWTEPRRDDDRPPFRRHGGTAARGPTMTADRGHPGRTFTRPTVAVRTVLRRLTRHGRRTFLADLARTAVTSRSWDAVLWALERWHREALTQTVRQRGYASRLGFDDPPDPDLVMTFEEAHRRVMGSGTSGETARSADDLIAMLGGGTTDLPDGWKPMRNTDGGFQSGASAANHPEGR